MIRRAASTLAVLSCAALLTGCPSPLATSQWVEAPVVADAVVRNHAGPAEFRADNPEGLAVKAGDQAVVKFSLATLPDGNTPRVAGSGSGGVVNTGASGYVLDASKVVYARLVLYVDKVNQPGFLGISALPGTQCWPRPDLVPTCSPGTASASDPANPNAQSRDANAPANALGITAPGFVSFDVTAAVRSWISNPATNNGLQIRTFADGGTEGDFVFASIENAGESVVPHQPQLYVTLSDMVGTAVPLDGTSVAQTAPNENRADQDIEIDGRFGSRAFGLFRFNPAEIVGNGIALAPSGLITKSSVVARIRRAAAAVGAGGNLELYGTPDFVTGTITWSTFQPPLALFPEATRALNPALGSEIATIDASYLAANRFVEAFNADVDPRSLPPFSVALTSSVPAPLVIDDVSPPHRARLVQATRGLVLNSNVDVNDDTKPFEMETRVGATLRARIGQPFPRVQLRMRTPGGSPSSATGTLYTPINLHMPDSGPSADVGRTLSGTPPLVTIWYGNEGDVFTSRSGNDNWATFAVRANRVVGTYVAHASLPGHNDRATLALENLPLPLPVLSGPATLEIPAGATEVSSEQFVLAVDDPVGAVIDDTTDWLFTSSVATDLVPAEVQQTDGVRNVAFTFRSAGPRVLTVTSKGDSSVQSTFVVEVDFADALFRDGFEP